MEGPNELNIEEKYQQFRSANALSTFSAKAGKKNIFVIDENTWCVSLNESITLEGNLSWEIGSLFNTLHTFEKYLA